jgi:hypothetical protein
MAVAVENVLGAGAQKTTNETNQTNQNANFSYGTYEATQEAVEGFMLDFKLNRVYYPPQVTEFFTQVSPRFFEGNVMKYVIRCEQPSRKDKKLEDIEKALTYLNMIGEPEIMAEKRAYVNCLSLPKEWQKDVINSLMIGDLGSCITILWCVRKLADKRSVVERVKEQVVGKIKFQSEEEI